MLRRHVAVCVILLLLLHQHPLQAPDVLDGVPERVHLGHLFLLGRGRNVLAKHLESRVHLLDAIALTSVAPRHFGWLRRRNGVTQGRVEGDLAPASRSRWGRGEDTAVAAAAAY